MSNAAARRYMQTVIKDRQRFYQPAQKLFEAALNAQLRPVLAKVSVHEHGSVVDHLVKSTPLKDAFRAIYTEVGNHFARAQYDSLMGTKSMRRKDDGDEEDDFTTAWRGQVEDFLDAEGAEMIENITDSTRQMIKDFLQSAIKNGTPASELAADLRDHWKDLSRSRSMTIAVNEVNRAQNFATYEGGEMTGLELEKTWVHSGSGDNDRDDHIDADGQTVDYDEEFDIGDGYAPMYPHDGSGDAEDEVNCHCTFYSARKK